MGDAPAAATFVARAVQGSVADLADLDRLYAAVKAEHGTLDIVFANAGTTMRALTDYFKAVRAAFDDRSIRRGIVIVEGDHVACQTWIDGRFVHEFTHSPAGPLPPSGQRVVCDLSSVFRFDDRGRLVEKWVRTDYRSFLRQPGAEGR